MKLLSRLRNFVELHENTALSTPRNDAGRIEEAEIDAFGVGTVMPADLPGKTTDDCRREHEAYFC